MKKARYMLIIRNIHCKLSDNMIRKLLLPTIIVALAACSSKTSLMSTSEVASYADSLGQEYMVNVSLNLDYLKRHPLTIAEKTALKEKIIHASRAWSDATHLIVHDSVGTFTGKEELTSNEYSRMMEKRDSLKWEIPVDGIAGPLEMEFLDRYKICFGYIFSQLRERGDEVFLPKNAYLVDKETNDTTHVSIIDQRYSVISNPPFIAYTSFDVQFNDSIYTFYCLHDIRAKEFDDSEIHGYFRIK